MQKSTLVEENRSLVEKLLCSENKNVKIDTIRAVSFLRNTTRGGIMKINYQQLAVERTQQIMEQWYCGNVQPLLEVLSEDASWIGAASGQSFYGRAAVEQALKNAEEDVPVCEVTRQSYRVASAGADFCLVMGRLTVTLQSESQLLRENQRLSFLWTLCAGDGKLLLTHAHVSNPAAFIETDETFPLRASSAAYRYIHSQLEKPEYVQLEATGGALHHVDPRQVVYLEAAREYVILHCKDGNLRVHSSLRAVQELFPQLVRIHRSYCVNPDYIKAVGSGGQKQLFLCNGEKLPVARSRRAALEAALDR